MKRLSLLLTINLSLMSCNDSFTGPGGVKVPREERTARSNLGFYIFSHKDYVQWGGTITKDHEDLPDQWWMELMGDLYNAGYEQSAADPTDILGYVNIKLRKPRGEHEYIYCDNMSGEQGACYHISTKMMEVPGNYPTSTLTERPRSQPLKHEMLHHFCHKKFGHGCLAKEGPDKGKHIYPAPNNANLNIWDFTWDRGQSTMSHQQYLELMFVEQHDLGFEGGIY